ncbi:hypothetical protein P692DRAFT_20830798, partial [Suillus brevipes Sb2]
HLINAWDGGYGIAERIVSGIVTNWFTASIILSNACKDEDILFTHRGRAHAPAMVMMLQ